MSAIRRLYFYILVLLSAEVIIWGSINLLRTFTRTTSTEGNQTLATGISAVLVGVPIFLLHWLTAQRDAMRDAEERASRIRAVFLYAALFATLLPIIYALLALIDRELVALFGGIRSQAWFGGDGSALDNLIAIAVNAAAFAYFSFILRADWRAENLSGGIEAGSSPSALVEARRLYRYIWVLIGLTTTVVGTLSVLRFLLSFAAAQVQSTALMIAGAVSLLAIGVPLLLYNWLAVQASLAQVDERRSLLRLLVLYLISLAGVVGVLATGGHVLNMLVRWVSGEAHTLPDFLRENSTMIGWLIPLGLMWWYYGQILNREVSANPDQPRREALRRLYNYLLALLGLAVFFVGIFNLVIFLIAWIFENSSPGDLRDMLGNSISLMLIGLPLWLITWSAMEREASLRTDTGDRARRSPLRKAYLYIVLFLLVVGVMTFTGLLLYTIIDAVLSGTAAGLGKEAARLLLTLVIDAVLFVYHWRALRQDAQIAQHTMYNLHGAFPTLILIEENGVYTRAFTDALLQALQKTAPRLPVAVHLVERGVPDDAMLGAKAVIMAAGLAIQPPESLSLWLNEYKGRRMIIPAPQEGWFWFGAPAEKRPQDLGREAAQSLRQLAEGENVRAALPSSPWAVVGYILGGLFGLQLLFALFSLLISSIYR